MNIYVKIYQEGDQDEFFGIPSKRHNDRSFTLDGSFGRDQGSGTRALSFADFFKEEELQEITSGSVLIFGKVLLTLQLSKMGAKMPTL